jgi:hypothetical protein
MPDDYTPPNCTFDTFCQESLGEDPTVILTQLFPPLTEEDFNKIPALDLDSLKHVLCAYLIHGLKGGEAHDIAQMLAGALLKTARLPVSSSTIENWRKTLQQGVKRLSPKRSLLQTVFTRRETLPALAAFALMGGPLFLRRHPYSLWVSAQDTHGLEFFSRIEHKGQISFRRDAVLTQSVWTALRPTITPRLCRRLIRAVTRDPDLFTIQAVRQFLALLPLGRPDVFSLVTKHFASMAHRLLRHFSPLERITNGHLLVHLGAVCEHGIGVNTPSRYLAIEFTPRRRNRTLFETKDFGIREFYEWLDLPTDDGRVEFLLQCSPDLAKSNFDGMPYNASQSAHGYEFLKVLSLGVRAAWDTIDDSAIKEASRLIL